MSRVIAVAMIVGGMTVGCAQPAPFPTGRLVDLTHLFEKNVPAFENVANLEALPETGFTVIALPVKIRGGSGGPLRIVAVVP